MAAFEFQGWPVYARACNFAEFAFKLTLRLKAPEARELRDQLRRASQSIVQNIAEGCARHTPNDKINFWRVSKGSVFECVAILDLITRFELATDFETEYRDLEEIGKMLSRLIRFVSKNPRRP